MKLSEKLYAQRRLRGLSQEQLAEKLGVSRQAISKWESGTAVPESEKLIALSTYFGVSVDYLIKDEIEAPEEAKVGTRVNKTDVIPRYIGFGLCILGSLLILVMGIIMLVDPGAFDSLANSSVITIDGRGVMMIASGISVVVGIVLLIKNRNER